MTDRELLELAAKAAGYDLLVRDNWNPLTDDGDALRLAVKLQIDVLIYNCWAKAKCKKGRWNMVDIYGVCKTIEEATRRSIVRAAAEIGRAMQWTK